MARGHHRRASGGNIPEEKGKALSYTAESNVEKEAEGEERKHGGRAKKRAAGGAVSSGAAKGFARGGGVKKHVASEGGKMGRRLDRPGRKRGGGVGADMRPLSTAAKTTQAGAHKADNDELA